MVTASEQNNQTGLEDGGGKNDSLELERRSNEQKDPRSGLYFLR
jgi:hypothetical protein